MAQAVSLGWLGPGRLNCVGYKKSQQLVSVSHFQSLNKYMPVFVSL